MTIIIVEDDYRQSEEYVGALREGIPGARIQLVETAAAFIKALPDLEKDVPAFVITDLMLPWDDPDNFASVAPGDYSLATGGIYLINRLKAVPVLASIPIILWTAVDCRDEVASLSTVKILLKSQVDPSDMVKHVRSVLIANGVTLPDKKSVVSKVASGIEIRPSFFGVSINVTKVLKSLARKDRKR